MRRYLVDTAPLAAYLLGRAGAVATLDPWLDQREVATSLLVYGEVTEYLKGLPDSPHVTSASGSSSTRFVPTC